MNLPAILNGILNGAKGLAGNIGLKIAKHSDKIFIVAGIVGMGVTVGEAVVATNKTHDILEETDKELAIIENCQDPEYTTVLANRDRKILKRWTRKKLIFAWLPVATTFAASAFSIGRGYCIINGRYVGAVAAYDNAMRFTNRYRQNVVNKFGKDVDWELAHTIQAEEMEKARKEQDENQDIEAANKHRKIKKKPKTAYQNINNQIFDYHSDYWKRWWTPAQAIEHVERIERECQSELEAKGHLFLNRVYERLGLRETTQGALIGWVNRPSNTHREPGTLLSLGFANGEMPEEEIRHILASPTNEDISIWITPNCDGVIYQYIDKPFSERD